MIPVIDFIPMGAVLDSQHGMFWDPDEKEWFYAEGDGCIWKPPWWTYMDDAEGWYYQWGTTEWPDRIIPRLGHEPGTEAAPPRKEETHGG
jgi:hypothetical protein